MSELLTAKDVEVKVFKKVRFGGYSVPEVEDFLNQVADDLEAYVSQLDEKDARIQELEAFVKKQEAMTDAIKDALIQARKAAKDMEEQARSQTEKIIADAKEEAGRHIAEADGLVQARIDEAERKAADMLAHARISADEITRASQDRQTKAEESLSNIEGELEARRREAEIKADEILSSAKTEARKLVSDAQREAEGYTGQMKFLNLQKQKFLNDAYSLLIDFGKVIDKAQDEIEAEVQAASFAAPENEKEPQAPTDNDDKPENSEES